MNLALFAMLALWISPALAWVCCCHAEPALAQHNVSQTAKPKAHSCCPQPSKTAQVSAQHDCDCDSAQNVVVARAEAPDSFPFAPVVVSVSPIQFHLNVARLSTQIGYITWEARPRGPDPFTRGGRAPPAFLA
ncbi:hypothetical protein EON80_26130 [bacterium]|nr:MAG: hypothetical protein EON80_26130 [bacterium]